MSNYPGNYSQNTNNQGVYGGYTHGLTGPPAGIPGYQGTPGYQGSSGYQGSQGYQQGTQGYQGMPGYQGNQGTLGYPGVPAPSAPPNIGYPGGHAMPVPPPGADPTLWNWFLTVDRDRSGQITAIELKQALINGNWTQFNDETCRLMISMFDKDQSGTINFTEFSNLWTYIQQWKGVFDHYDRDRSGAIEFIELQTALSQMGYRVSPNFVNLLIASCWQIKRFVHLVVGKFVLISPRFDTEARRSMKLDSFIQCCVMLRLLTDAFVARDTNRNGIININYEDFMCMVIENKA